MGVERARVMELRSGGAGYLVDDRLVLTAGSGAGDVRPAGTATWLATSTVWRSPTPAGAAILELDDPSFLMMPPVPPGWGRVTGRRPVAVTGMGFPPGSSQWPRDPERFVGHVTPSDRERALAVTPAAALAGAALFAGAELVGVLVSSDRAVPVADQALAEALGRPVFVDVCTPATAVPYF